jgi:hypothetical protein
MAGASSHKQQDLSERGGDMECSEPHKQIIPQPVKVNPTQGFRSDINICVIPCVSIRSFLAVYSSYRVAKSTLNQHEGLCKYTQLVF